MALSVQNPVSNNIFRAKLTGWRERKTEMAALRTRFETFYDYPRKNKPFLLSFANAGFYSMKNGDEVGCFDCGITLRGWVANDDPKTVHQHLSPNCAYLTTMSQSQSINTISTREGLDLPNEPMDTNESDTGNLLGATGYTRQPERPTENQPATDRTRKRPRMGLLGGAQSPHDGTGPEASSSADSINSRLSPDPSNNHHHQRQFRHHRNQRLSRPPKFPTYATYSSRLNSFSTCQDLTVPKEELSQAGFYYAGGQDRTRCFHCGIGLMHWSYGDNAMEEHIKYSPNCPFVLTERPPLISDVDQLIQADQFPSLSISSTPVERAQTQTPATTHTNAKRSDGQTEAPETPEPDFKRLKQENHKLNLQRYCFMCRSEEVRILFLPCSHLITCEQCADSLTACCMCDEQIVGTVKTYRA